MYKSIGIIAGLLMCASIGSILDPHDTTHIFNMMSVEVSSCLLGFILGAIADGVNK